MHPVYATTVRSGPNPAPPEFQLVGAGAGSATDAARFATPLAGNLLESPSQVVHQVAALPARGLLWSGWYERDGEDELLPSAMTWSPGAWKRLAEFCTGAATRLSAPAAAQGTRVCFLPRAGDVLSDLPSCQRFLQLRSDWVGPVAERFEILLDPVGMLTADMLPFALEHVERIVLGLGHATGIAGILLSNVTAGDGIAIREPVHRGVISADFLGSLLRECNADVPILLTSDDVPAQLEALGFDLLGRATT